MNNLTKEKETKYFLNILKLLNNAVDVKEGFYSVFNYLEKKLNVNILFYDFYSDRKTAVSNSFKDVLEAVPLPVTIPIKEYQNPMFLKTKQEIHYYFPDTYHMYKFKEVISIPLNVEDKIKYMFLFYKEDEEPFTEECFSFFKKIELELLNFTKRIERQDKKLEKSFLKLNKLEDLFVNEISKETDVSEILHKIVEILPEISNVRKCTIAILDNTGEYLLPRYSNHMNKEEIKNLKYPMNPKKAKDHTGIIAIRNKEPVVIQDALSDPRCDPEISRKVDVYSNITVPLIDIRGNALGVMYVDNGRYEVFSKEQINILSIIGRHLGMILSSYLFIKQLSNEKNTDGLTELFNKTCFFEQLEAYHYNYKPFGEPYSILMIDIDDFKILNDTHGHLEGDKAIKKVADILTHALKGDDIIARYGGEEYVVLLKDANTEVAKILAERIRYRVQEELAESYNLTITVGVSSLEEGLLSPRDLIDLADKRLYYGKRTGKNKVVIKF